MPARKPLERIAPDVSSRTQELLEKDSRYCSFGDTVHYADPPKFFTECDGSYLFDQMQAA